MGRFPPKGDSRHSAAYEQFCNVAGRPCGLGSLVAGSSGGHVRVPVTLTMHPPLEHGGDAGHWSRPSPAPRRHQVLKQTRFGPPRLMILSPPRIEVHVRLSS